MTDGQVCVLCGHRMTFDSCGKAGVTEGALCHADDHDCYRAWTVYNIRPGDTKAVEIARWLSNDMRRRLVDSPTLKEIR